MEIISQNAKREEMHSMYLILATATLLDEIVVLLQFKPMYIVF